MFGADVAALRGLAWSLRQRQADIEATGRRLTALVDSLPWMGADHDRFVQQWHGAHGPALSTIASEMSVAAGQVSYHARRQEQASRRA